LACVVTVVGVRHRTHTPFEPPYPPEPPPSPPAPPLGAVQLRAQLVGAAASSNDTGEQRPRHDHELGGLLASLPQTFEDSMRWWGRATRHVCHAMHVTTPKQGTVVSAITGGGTVFNERIIANWGCYVKAHGIESIIVRHNWLNGSAATHEINVGTNGHPQRIGSEWSGQHNKLFIIKLALLRVKPNSWVLWLDNTDAVFTNFSATITEVIDEAKRNSPGQDCNVVTAGSFNAGVVAFQHSCSTFWFLDYWLEAGFRGQCSGPHAVTNGPFNLAVMHGLQGHSFHPESAQMLLDNFHPNNCSSSSQHHLNKSIPLSNPSSPVCIARTGFGGVIRAAGNDITMNHWLPGDMLAHFINRLAGKTTRRCMDEVMAVLEPRPAGTCNITSIGPPTIAGQHNIRSLRYCGLNVSVGRPS